MKNLPQGFISTILAQKKLSGNGNSNNGSNVTVSDDYSFNPNIKELPSFNTPDNSKRDNEDYGLPLSTIASTLARKAKSLYESYLASEEGETLLEKAAEYEIPYDANNIDIITLRDKVEEFESAIELASQYGIDWKTFGYDLLAIEQEIADAQVAERDYLNYARNQFLTTRGIVA
jgi:hypothetical protein